ncbi:MAG TPA: type II toxin-antitoxin system VapC family toxin [Gemmatimonadales bacterium]
MIVADVNLVAALLLGGVEADRARAIFERDPEWAAPVLWRSEFRSILGAYMRRRGLGLADAWLAHEMAERLLAPREQLPDGERVLHLVSASPCSAYDCEYVALGEALRVPLVTSDRQVLRHFPEVAISPDGFLAALDGPRRGP